MNNTPLATGATLWDRVRGQITARRALFLLLLMGLGLRLWLIAINPIDPSSSSADDGDYYRRAIHLAITGQYLDDSWLIRPPGHIFFFAAWMRIGVLAGDYRLGVLLVKLAEAAAGVAQIALGYGVARRIFRSPWAGVLFAAFLALWYPFVEQPSLLFSELLYSTLFMAHFWLLLRFDESEKKRDLVLSGLFLGMAALTRSPALYSVAFVAMWLLVRQWVRQPSAARGWLARLLPTAATLRHAALVVGCCLAVVLPWTARNYIEYRHFIPVDTLGQVNLWLDLDTVDQRNPHIEELRGMPQADRAGYAMAKAREILAEDPLRPLRNFWPTFRHVWKAQFVEDYYLRESFYDRPLRQAAPLGLAGDVMWLVFVGAGLAGLAARPREGWHNRLFTLAWIGYSLFTVVVFHVEPRYLLPFWTLIALYGGGQLAALLGARPARPRLDGVLALQAALLVAYAALLVTYRDYPAIISGGEARERGMRAGDSAFARGDYAQAEQAYAQAQDAQPSFQDAGIQRALSQMAQGKREEAAATVENIARRTAWLTGLVARGGGPENLERLTYAEASTGLDVQRWVMRWTKPAPAATVHLGDGRDMGYIAGFSPSESDQNGSYRWMTGRGTVRIPLPQPLAAGSRLVLRLAAPSDTPLTVDFGGSAQTITVAGGQWRTYTLPIPPELEGQQTLAVELRATPFIPWVNNPASNDLRQISVMVSDISAR